MKFVIAITSTPNEPVFYIQPNSMSLTRSLNKARRWDTREEADKVAEIVSYNVSEHVKDRLDFTVIAVDIQLSELGELLCG